MKTMLVGNNIPKECACTLEKMGYRLVLLPPFDRLQAGVSTHADMLVFYDGNTILTHKDYYKNNRELFDSVGVKIQTTDENISCDYPNDVLFNAVLTSDGVLYSKTEFTSRFIKEKSRFQNNVKQGYTACSTCRVSERAFITTDTGLFRAYTEGGIECLLVDKDGIFLEGYDCGFIGGATAVDENYVYFFGNAKEHGDYKAIEEFVGKQGKTVVSLGESRLTDIGGAAIIL